MARMSWFSEEGDEIIFQRYAERMESWQKAIADGRITEQEVREQATRVADLLRGLDEQLDDQTHERVSQAFFEWSVLQGMHTSLMMQAAPSDVRK